MLFGPLILFFKANFVFPTLLDIYQIFKAQYVIILLTELYTILKLMKQKHNGSEICMVAVHSLMFFIECFLGFSNIYCTCTKYLSLLRWEDFGNNYTYIIWVYEDVKLTVLSQITCSNTLYSFYH